MDAAEYLYIKLISLKEHTGAFMSIKCKVYYMLTCIVVHINVPGSKYSRSNWCSKLQSQSFISHTVNYMNSERKQ